MDPSVARREYAGLAVFCSCCYSSSFFCFAFSLFSSSLLHFHLPTLLSSSFSSASCSFSSSTSSLYSSSSSFSFFSSSSSDSCPFLPSLHTPCILSVTLFIHLSLSSSPLWTCYYPRYPHHIIVFFPLCFHSSGVASPFPPPGHSN